VFYSPPPDGEMTSFVDWAEGGVGLWAQTLLGSFDWTGAWLREPSPRLGQDDCWFQGSIKGKWEVVTTPDYIWIVNNGNGWAYDGVGWLQEGVDAYRSPEVARAPCSATVYQQMQILSEGDWINYASENTLGGEIYGMIVTSIRAGQQNSRVH
jgi:hypothetical protein